MPWVLATTVFCLLIVVLLHPLPLHLADRFVVDGGLAPDGTEGWADAVGQADAYLNAWILDHVHSRLGPGMFDAPIFYPSGGALALSEHMLGNLPLYGLARAIRDEPAFGYNLFVLLSTLAAALGAFALTRSLGLGMAPALLAGAIFAFFPGRLARAADGEVQLLGLYWLPWALTALLAWLRRGRRSALAAFGALVALQLLSSMYLAYFTAAGLAVALPVLLAGRRGSGEPLSRHLAAWATAAGAAVPLFALSLPYLGQGAQGALKELRFVWTLNSADPILSYVLCPPRFGEPLRAGGAICADLVSNQVHLGAGLVALALAVVGVAASIRRPPEGRSRRGLLAVLSAAGVGWLLSLGPALVLGGEPVELAGLGTVPLPYALLAEVVPGFRFLRVPARFALLASLGLAVAAAAGLAALLGRLRGRGARALVATAVLALVALEYRHAPLRLEPAETPTTTPEIVRRLAGIEPAAPLVVLPTGSGIWARAPLYVYRSAFHRHPLMNGYSGHFPEGYFDRMRLANRLPDPAAAAALRHLGVELVLVHEDDPEALRRHREERMKGAGLELLTAAGGGRLYRLPPVD